MAEKLFAELTEAFNKSILPMENDSQAIERLMIDIIKQTA